MPQQGWDGDPTQDWSVQNGRQAHGGPDLGFIWIILFESHSLLEAAMVRAHLDKVQADRAAAASVAAPVAAAEVAEASGDDHEMGEEAVPTDDDVVPDAVPNVDWIQVLHSQCCAK